MHWQSWTAQESGSFSDAKNWQSKTVPKKNAVAVITGDADDEIKVEKPYVHALSHTTHIKRGIETFCKCS